MLHGYCIRRASDPGPEPGLTGVGGEGVHRVVEQGLAMWVSPLAAGGVDPVRLREHETVVRRALATETPLPLRFGARFRDEDEVAARLRERAGEFLALLEEFMGHVELGVRVIPLVEREEVVVPVTRARASATDAVRTPGRDHLEARRRARTARSREVEAIEAAMARIRAETADLRVPTRSSLVAATPPFGSVAHLVRRSDVPAFRDRIAAIASRNPDLRISITGPWAPYSFVE